MSLARIAAEIERIAAELEVELYVVIGNYGRGNQVLWPKTDRPEAYTKREAEQIAERQNNSQSGSRPGGEAAWHAKPLDQAERWVARGRALDGLRELRMRIRDDY